MSYAPNSKPDDAAKYSETDIIRHVGNRAFGAGRVYQKQSRVLAFAQNGDVIESTVRGSAPRPYTQRILTRLPSGKPGMQSSCSCPVGSYCKHVAAALLEGLKRRLTGEPPASRPPVALRPVFAEPLAPEPPKLPHELSFWLESLDMEIRRAANAAGTETQRIVYLFEPNNAGRFFPSLKLQTVSARLRKDGLLAKSPQKYEPRNAFNSSRPAKFLRPDDFRIFRRLVQARGEYGGWSSTRDAAFTTEEALELVGEIVATGRAHWREVESPALALGPARPGKIRWDAENGVDMRPHIEIDDGLIALNAAPPVYVDPAAGLIGPIDLGLAPRVANALLDAPPAPIEHVALLQRKFAEIPVLKAVSPPEPAPPTRLSGPPQFVLRLMSGKLPMEDWNSAAVRRHGLRSYLTSVYDDDATETVGLARLVFRYGPVDLDLTEARAVVTRLHKGGLVEIHRDRSAEQEAVTQLRLNGFSHVHEARVLAPQRHRLDFLPEADDELGWFDALQQDIPRLREQGWSVEIDADFPVRLLDGRGDFSAQFHEGSGIDWLELDLGVTIEEERIDLVGPIASLIGAGDFDPHFFADEGAVADEPFYLRLADGRYLSIEKARLAPIVLAIYELVCGGAPINADGRLRLSLTDAAVLAQLEASTRGAGLVWRGGEKLRELGRKLTAANGLPAVELPETFTASLRPYQEQGVAWLALMRAVGLGGVLADDMGLGKTVQALALIAIEKAAGRLTQPALVIAPTSLMANWRREAEKFARDLKVVVLQGSDRKKRFDEIDGADIVLSTYPLIARDHEMLSTREWSLLLLDEAQTIKNPNATTTKLIRSLSAPTRFCLTGTPLENHLGELWSIFAFALPGFLGELPAFNQAFRTPIEKRGDAARGKLLASRVKPFLLRRTKEEVASELPPKTEIIERIEMSPAQRDIYESIRLSMHDKVRAAIAAKGFARSRIVILDALLKLRQCCCDPQLLKLSAKTSSRAGSAKRDRLFEMLEELLEEGRRVLVFSQFTSMLDLIRPKLDELEIAYSLLTGDTRDRAKAINDFQDGKTNVFLISLKAGGVGLNLTAADTVILYDPWWNPAVEDQAIDRAHRIGQDKPVFVHKLVVSGTIEEKMEELKAKKRALAESIFDHDGAPTLAMTEADLDQLFAPV